MSDSVPPEERQSGPRLDSWDAVARYAVTKLIDAIFSGKSPWLILGVLALLELFQILYIYSLPGEARVGIGSPIVETAEAVSSILSSNPMAWLGWVFFVVALLFFSPVVWIIWRQVQSQGDLIKKERDVRINDRVSSRNEKSIDEYDERMKEKFGDENDTDND